MANRIILLILWFLGFHTAREVSGQGSPFVDDQGIMRWGTTGDEVCAFGTNYSIPFAYWDWRAPIGVDYEQAIDEDVYHMARLGLDGYRIHVWPSMISDTLGNLIYNRHFQLFDYLLYRLKERGILAYITPMYLSGGTQGFPYKYGMKTGCLSDTAAFAPQANYLAQFVSHVNPYTGIAYKDDPDILAFEIVNEPGHWKRPDLTTGYINMMYDTIRATGCIKPIMYNMTTSAEFIDQILASKVEGGSFQWYPSGLTANHDQKGNMLPNVDKYHIPFIDKLKGTNRPIFGYEFSPSDIGASSHLYPAMARSFREAGFQFMAHFAYDPMHAAYCNVEYRTHFLNLAYTPKKAIGLMIANEVFHAVPLWESYGRYPENNRFESFRIDYEDDLAEMVTDQKFLHSNHTSTLPPRADLLEQVAGTGSSPVVNFTGNGAYFLDKLEDGVWRLEVMPDALWVRDPFFVPSVQREAAVTISREHWMAINLPDLQEEFSIEGLNEGNHLQVTAEGSSFVISPGAYLLTRKGKSSRWNGEDTWMNIRLNEFYEPDRLLEKTYVLHDPPWQTSAGKALELEAKIVAPFQPGEVEVIILGVGGGETYPMVQKDPYHYIAEIPQEMLQGPQQLRYHISIRKGDKCLLYPKGNEGDHLLARRIYTDDRFLDDGQPYEIQVVDSNAPVCLFDSDRDWRYLTKPGRQTRIDCYPGPVPGKSMMHLSIPNLNSEEHDFSVRSYCRDRIEERLSDVNKKNRLVFYGNSLYNRPCKLQMALIMTDGSTYGGLLSIDETAGYYEILLKDLKKVKSVLLPRPYPKFQVYWFEPSKTELFDLSLVESLQISIGPGIPESEYDLEQGVAIGWISIQ